MTSGREEANYLSADHKRDPALAMPAITNAAEIKSAPTPSIASPVVLRNRRSTRFVGMSIISPSAGGVDASQHVSRCQKAGGRFNPAVIAASRFEFDQVP